MGTASYVSLWLAVLLIYILTGINQQKIDKFEHQLNGWHCKQVNTQHKADQMDDCIQFTKERK